MRRQGLKWTKEKLPNTDLMDKIKANVVYFTTVEPSTTKEGKYILRYMRTFTHTTSIRGNKYIYVMYVYDCNAILTTATKNRSYKEVIIYFK